MGLYIEKTFFKLSCDLGDNFSSDITINIIITRKEVEKLRKDLKNLTGYKIWWIEEDSNIKYHNIIC